MDAKGTSAAAIAVAHRCFVLTAIYPKMTERLISLDKFTEAIFVGGGQNAAQDCRFASLSCVRYSLELTHETQPVGMASSCVSDVEKPRAETIILLKVRTLKEEHQLHSSELAGTSLTPLFGTLRQTGWV